MNFRDYFFLKYGWKGVVCYHILAVLLFIICLVIVYFSTKWGFVIGGLIIVLLLFIIGIYFIIHRFKEFRTNLLIKKNRADYLRSRAEYYKSLTEKHKNKN